MSMYTLLRNKGLPSFQDMETAFQGNLCRCTGYRPILEGFKSFTLEGQVGSVNGGGCCGNKVNGGCCMNGSVSNGTNGTNGTNGHSENGEENDELFSPSEFLPYDPSQEPIFPPELLVSF